MLPGSADECGAERACAVPCSRSQVEYLGREGLGERGRLLDEPEVLRGQCVWLHGPQQ